jgi:hypothetical protein
MTYLKQLYERLTPTLVVSILTALLALLVTFGVTLTTVQEASVLAFTGVLAVIVLLGYLSPQTILGLVAAAIQVATAFGLPITAAQNESILELTGLLAGILLVHGVSRVVTISRKQPPAQPSIAAPPASAKKGHPKYKLGRRKPKNAPALLLRNILSGVFPASPATADHFGKLTFGLYGNDKYGVCGPTGVANLVRLVTGGLLGTEIQPSQEDVYDLYRRSGNPNFNPVTGEGDSGVDMQTMLEELLKNGIGDGQGGTVKPVAFAKVNVNSDAELEAAVAIFGGCLWGVTLDVAQQAQTNANPPTWDYVFSGVWGGHAVLNGAYENGFIEDVISWDLRVETTETFRAKQLEEAWVVVWEWNLEHPAFLEGVDVAALAAAYKALTGKELPIPAPSPTPTPPAPTPVPPSPTPVPPTPPAPVPPAPGTEPSAADRALWEATKGWVQGRHSGATKQVAARMAAWAKALGLSALLLLLVALAGCGSTTTTTGSQQALLTAKCIHYHYVVGPDGKRHRVPCNVPPTPNPNPVPSPHPSPSPTPPPPAPIGSGPQVSTCDWQTGNGCSAVPSSCHYQGTGGGVLPDPTCTPGALYGPSQSSPKTTVCVSGFTSTIRPPVSYTGPLKLKIMAAYGVGSRSPSLYELDHLVALEDGGAPADPANLWPEPYAPTPGAHQKDREENLLRTEECSGAITVAQAGQELASNWFGAYNRDKP